MFEEKEHNLLKIHEQLEEYKELLSLPTVHIKRKNKDYPGYPGFFFLLGILFYSVV
jgi:hypothetical protein